MDPSAFPTLDPELAAVVELLPDMTAGLDDVELSRASLASVMPSGPFPGEDELDVTDEVVDGVPVRVYRPRGVPGELPGVLYLHSGGFCLGSVDMEHGGAVQVAHRVGAVVVSVEYRLAPEHPYPAGLEDCYVGLQHLAALEGVDPSRLAVHGQSAGGGLTAATTLLARDRGGPALAFQSLVIPQLDDSLSTPSMQAFTSTPMWSRPQGERSWEHYLGGRPADGYASPTRMEDLAGLPPAYVMTMELDPLRDEGILYAMRLLAAGVSVELHSFPGTFHGSAMAVEAQVSKRMSQEMLGALRRGLGVTSPAGGS
jgi:acetyl esterase/lipase